MPRVSSISVIPIYKQNNFGVTAGGPVYLPKLYNGKNKTFFFASYEGFRNRVGAGNGSFLQRAAAGVLQGRSVPTG